MSLGAHYWNARFSEWGPALPEQPGYSLLMPVPGDLPVFLELALAVCQLQDPASRVETLVLPDRMTPSVRNIVSRHRAQYPGDLRLVPLPQPERTVLPRLRNPSHNHGVQIITGIRAARGSHVVLHDADLFLLQPDALERHYRATRERDLYVAGVSPVWDGWFAERGWSLVATWEMCAWRGWLRSFPPHMHMGHDAEIYGQSHTFDTTLHPQALTPPERIGLLSQDEAIVHFNYVISTYRHFQRSSGTFTDDNFRLLLIRVFIDLFAQEPCLYEVPPLTELADGLTDPGARVTYEAPSPGTRERFAAFRGKLDRILDGPWTPPGERDRARAALEAFDNYYGLDYRTS